MNLLNRIVTKIIKEQEAIIGPLAWIEAKKIDGFKMIDSNNGVVDFNDNVDQKEIVNQLVGRYERLFGKTSIQVCRDSVMSILAELSPTEIPSSLVV